MDKKPFIVVFLVTLILLVGGIFAITREQKKTSYTGLDDFAKCLTEKNTVMYGAYWCSHCQNTKKTFGDSFQYIKYVECTQDVKTCTDLKISGYPTWIIGGEKRFEGEQTLQQLSSATSCQLPQTQ